MVLKTIFALLLCLTTTARLTAENVQQQPKTVTNFSAKRQLSYVIIKNRVNNYGYDILDHNRIIIHQPNVPGAPGNKGFATKEDAAKVAKLVMKKIKNNIMPPTVTQNELRSLKTKL